MMARQHKCPIAGIRCPHNADPARGAWCPAWTQYAQTNISSGEERVVEECMFQAIPKFMLEGVKASNRAAATAESQRNVIHNGFRQLVSGVQQTLSLREESHDASQENEVRALQGGECEGLPRDAGEGGEAESRDQGSEG